MEVIGHNTGPDWPKLGPSMLIATALVVAIRTARWVAKAPGAGLSDVDPELDREVDFAVRVADRLLHALLKKHPGCFPSGGTRSMRPTRSLPPDRNQQDYPQIQLLGGWPPSTSKTCRWRSDRGEPCEHGIRQLQPRRCDVVLQMGD